MLIHHDLKVKGVPQFIHPGRSCNTKGLLRYSVDAILIQEFLPVIHLRPLTWCAYKCFCFEKNDNEHWIQVSVNLSFVLSLFVAFQHN